jgi:hypothetical protein
MFDAVELRLTATKSNWAADWCSFNCELLEIRENGLRANWLGVAFTILPALLLSDPLPLMRFIGAELGWIVKLIMRRGDG